MLICVFTFAFGLVYLFVCVFVCGWLFKLRGLGFIGICLFGGLRCMILDLMFGLGWIYLVVARCFVCLSLRDLV